MHTHEPRLKFVAVIFFGEWCHTKVVDLFDINTFSLRTISVLCQATGEENKEDY